MPQGWIKASNSDNDGDKMFTMKRNNKKAEGVRNTTEDILFDSLVELASHESKMSQPGKGYNATLDTNKVKKATVEAEVALGIFETKEEAYKEYGLKENEDGSVVPDKEAVTKNKLNLSSMTGEIDAAQKMKESRKLIGAFAVGAKVINFLEQVGASLVSPMTLFGEVGRADGVRTFTSKNISEIAETLQLALDDANEVFMHNTGITIENSEIVVLLSSMGYDLKHILAFLKSAPISSISKRLKESKTVSTGEEVSFNDIIKEVRQEFSADDKLTVKIGNSEYSAESMINKYEELKEQSRALKAIRTIVQLDKGVPKDAISVMNTLGEIAKLEESKNKERKGTINVGSLFENPIVKARVGAIKSLANTYKKYFSALSTDEKTDVKLNDTLSSFDSKSKNIDNNKKARIVQKVYSKAVAQRISKYKYESPADVQ